MKYFSSLMVAVAATLLVGCSSPKKVPYMVGAENIPNEVLNEAYVRSNPIIAPGDMLNIDITAYNMAAVAPFNKGMTVSPDGAITTSNRGMNSNSTSESSTMYYLVDTDGNIEMPIIGTIHAAGLTKAQLAQEIKDAIYPKYVKEVPSVDIRLMNFRVTMLGAVHNPGIIEVQNERLNILEALAKAGDLDIQGQREDIMLIRTNNDGTREIHQYDLNDKNILLSPYFNLQQNDLIYVVPNQSMRNRSWQLSPAVTTTFTIVGGLSSIIALVVTIVNL